MNLNARKDRTSTPRFMLFLVVLLMVAVACGEVEEVGPEDAPDEEAAVDDGDDDVVTETDDPEDAVEAVPEVEGDITILYVTEEANVTSLQQAAEKYQQESGLDVAIDSYPQTAWRERLMSEIAAQSGHYDIWVIDHPEGALTAPHTVNLLDFILDPDIVDEERLAIEDIIPRTIAQATYDPDNPMSPPLEVQMPEYLWNEEPFTMDDFQRMEEDGFGFFGIPFHPNVLTMSYRADYFEDEDLRAHFEEEYGRELDPPEDWDEFVEVGQFFSEAHNPDSPTPYGATLMARRHESIYTDWRTWLASFGVDELDEDLRPSFNNEQGIEATQFYVDLIHEYGVVPEAATAWTWDEVGTAFGSGQTAMSMNYHRVELDPEVEEAGGQVEFAPIPGERQEDGTVLRTPHYGTYYLAINQYSDNHEQAYDFIEYAAAPEQMLEYGENLFHGSRRSYYEDQSVIDTRPEYWPIFSESLEQGFARPRLINFVEYSQTIQEHMSNAVTQEVTVEEALEQAEEAVETLFEREGFYDQ